MSLESAIDRVLSERFPSDEPGAAAVVARGGEVVFRRGYGLADAELDVAIRPEMVFRIGSITKQITAVAILTLVRDGLLALDEDFTAYLDGYPHPGPHIAVENLLTHTSGIPEHGPDPAVFGLGRRDVTVDELIGSFKELPLRFEPGQRFRYSNSGYFLLGAILESVSGLPLGELLEERVFGPLAMSHSGYWPAERVVPGRVRGYAFGRDGIRNASPISMSQAFAAGGVVSNVDDLLRWNAAFDDDALLPAELWRRALTPQRLADGTPTGYGYGVCLPGLEGRATVEHGGGIAGFRSHAIRLPDDGAYVAVLANSERDRAMSTCIELAHLVIGKPFEPPVALEKSEAALREYAGTYRFDGGGRVLIEIEAGRLAWVEGGLRFRLGLASESDFFFETWPILPLEFLRDGSGAISGLVHHRRLGPARAERLEAA